MIDIQIAAMRGNLRMLYGFVAELSAASAKIGAGAVGKALQRSKYCRLIFRFHRQRHENHDHFG